MFSSPLEFGRQAEDILWKKAFYEPVARFKSKVILLIKQLIDKSS